MSNRQIIQIIDIFMNHVQIFANYAHSSKVNQFPRGTLWFVTRSMLGLRWLMVGAIRNSTPGAFEPGIRSVF